MKEPQYRGVNELRRMFLEFSRARVSGNEKLFTGAA